MILDPGLGNVFRVVNSSLAGVDSGSVIPVQAGNSFILFLAMQPPNIYYSALLMTAGITCLVVAIMIWFVHRKATGSRALVVVLLALTWWDLTYAVFWFDYRGPTPYFWLDMTLLGAFIVPTAFLIFSLEYAQMQKWLKPPFLWALTIEPIITFILLWTDPWHDLYFGGKRALNTVRTLDAGPVSWANVYYSYLLIFISIVVLGIILYRSVGIYRKQAIMILAAVIVPWIVHISYMSTGGPLPDADITPFIFTSTALFIAFALAHYRLLDIVPIARSTLIESMGDGILVLDNQNRVVDINPAAQTMIGLSSQSSVGKSVEKVFSHWPDVVANFRTITQARTEVTLGNNHFDLRISPLLDQHAQFVGRLIVWRDITRLKENELRLLQLTQAVEQSPASVVITDLMGNITYVNSQFTTMTGYAQYEVIGKTPNIVRFGQTPVELHRNISQTIQSGKTWRGEFLNKKKNGALYWEHAVLAPVTDHEGCIVNFIAVKEDVTERKQAAQALERRLSEIEELHKDLQETQAQLVKEQRTLAELEERQRLGRNMHDSVNQSIHSLMMSSETLAELLRQNKTEKAVYIAEHSQESGRQALKEIRLLVYETQSLFATQNMDFISALEERLNMVERRLGIKAEIINGNDIHTRCPPEWNENLYWMIMEALNNALKHAHARSIKVFFNWMDDQLEVAIEDDGTGFDSSQVQSGGMGTRTMRERAEMLGGQLSIQSSPENGTRVSFKVEAET